MKPPQLPLLMVNKREIEEMIYFDGKVVGLNEIFYCNGVIKKRGYMFGKPIGTWKEFNLEGKLVETIEYNEEVLFQNFKDIHYIK